MQHDIQNAGPSWKPRNYVRTKVRNKNFKKKKKYVQRENIYVHSIPYGAGGAGCVNVFFWKNVVRLYLPTEFSSRPSSLIFGGTGVQNWHKFPNSRVKKKLISLNMNANYMHQGSTLIIAHLPGASKQWGGASKTWEPLAQWGKWKYFRFAIWISGVSFCKL